MALSERIIDLIGTAIEELGELVGRLARGGVATFFMDRRDELKPSATPAMDAILENPLVPEELKSLVRDARGDSSPFDWAAYVLMQAGGLWTLIQALGQPAAQAVSGTQWRTNPVKLEDPAILISEYLRGKRSRPDIGERMLSQGYDEFATDAMISTALPLLNTDVLRDLELREAPESVQARADAYKAGWTDPQLAALRRLYWYIPGPQDLIRMAVREVFTPEIAEKFGQFEDFPSDFAKYGKMQGLSGEWALRYWAMHWDLPSPTQGFDMFHRMTYEPTPLSGGVEGEDEGGPYYRVISWENLEVLLRALDVMPAWREPLTKIAETLPSRVDIRRIYKLGIRGRDWVYKQYLSRGNPPDVADALTEFTIRYYDTETEDELDDERVLTKSEVLDGYRKRILDADAARELLLDLNYQADQVDFFLLREDLKIDQALRDAYLSRYRVLFVEGIVEIDEVKAALEPVGITPEEIDAELPLWQLDRVTRVATPTKAELRRFLQDGIIDEGTWYGELRLKGYSDRYIRWYRQEVGEIGGE